MYQKIKIFYFFFLTSVNKKVFQKIMTLAFNCICTRFQDLTKMNVNREVHIQATIYPNQCILKDRTYPGQVHIDLHETAKSPNIRLLSTFCIASFPLSPPNAY